MSEDLKSARHWCGTFFHGDNKEKTPVFDESSMRYMVGQEEKCPETNRLHFQFYCQFKSPQRLSALKKLCPTAHWEISKGSPAQNRAYCTKTESRVPGKEIYEFGSMVTQGTRTDWRDLFDEIKSGTNDLELFEKYPGIMIRNYKGVTNLKLLLLKQKANRERDVKVFVFHGPTGTGKTSAVWKRYKGKEDEIYSLPPCCNNSIWFDGYIGEKTLLIDEFTGKIPIATFLQILDRYRLQVPYKGGFVFANWDRIYITSNYHPSEWYPEEKQETQKALLRRLYKIVHYADAQSGGPTVARAARGSDRECHGSIVFSESDTDN